MSGRGPWPLQPEGPPPKSRRLSRRLSRRFSTASPPRPPGLPPQPLPAHRGSAPQGAGLESAGCPGSLRAFSRSAWPFPCHVPDSSRWRGRVSCQVCVVAPQRCQRRPGPAPGRPRVRVPPWRVPLLSSLPPLASPWGGARGSSPPPPGPARLLCTLVWILPVLARGPGVRAELCRHPDVRCVPCGRLPGLSTCEAESGVAVVTAAPQMRDA